MSPPKKRSKRVRSTSSSSSSSNRDASRTIPRHKRHIHAKSQRNKNVSDNISSYQSYNAYFNPNITLSNIIPEFDPKSIDIDDWLDILQHNAQIHKWSENFIVYQALNKLKGTAKAWYDIYIENEMGWSKLTWAQWMLILKNTFKTNRNAYKLLTDITNHKPTEGCSLYDFHFAHLAKINKLRLNFTDADKVSLVIGAINDSNISTAVEASTITDPNVLGAYLKNKIYCKNKEISQGPSRNVFNQKCYTSSFAFEELESEPAEVTSSEESFLPQFNNFDMDTFLECDKNSSVFQEFNAEEVFKMVLEDQSKNKLQDHELSNSDGDTDNSPSAVVTTENEITFETASIEPEEEHPRTSSEFTCREKPANASASQLGTTTTKIHPYYVTTDISERVPVIDDLQEEPIPSTSSNPTTSKRKHVFLYFQINTQKLR
ncbi:hypothetical protein RN001_012130 [Aquatica leii]|uniref:Retrotransposon gag domain-containing protein n=1 Tax=Aquatica leii TaxID=1421715 RepID=A0AAN7P548_9COLE|nr:hypothetical protein RN001_012130 [Aquatica leii]